jgi:hypothetical protein
MKTRFPEDRPGKSRKWMLASLALLLVAALFMASVVLPPMAAPVQALNAPALVTLQAPKDDGVNGTLASFTALIPELAAIHLPMIVR